MAASNNLDKFLGELSVFDYALEDLEDHSTTFQYLLEKAIDSSASKKETLQNLNTNKVSVKSDLNSEKQILRSLQEKRLKIEEAIEKDNEAVKSLEKERDDLIKKYTQSVDELYHKLSSVSDEFNPNTLKETIRELKQEEKEIEGGIVELFKQTEVLQKRMSKLPDLRALKNVRDQLFDENDQLGKKKLELDNINTFIKNLKANMEEVHK